MRIGYIHFDRSEQKKYLAIISRLSEEGAIDELGVGRIRDYFSDAMFPGISSLHQHAKYYVLLPLLYNKATTFRYTRPQDVRPQIVKLEKDLTEVLYNNSEQKTGITGRDFIGKNGYVRYDPTYIYATGLMKFGIIQCESIEEMIYAASKRRMETSPSDNEDGDPDISTNPLQFVHIPTDLGYDWETQCSLDLTKTEAEFIVNHITCSKACDGSLLSHIISNRLDLTDTETFESFVVKYSRSLPEYLSKTATKAMYFAKLVDGLFLRYNYIFSGYSDQKMKEKFNRWVETEFNRYHDAMAEAISDIWIRDNYSRPFCFQAMSAIKENSDDFRLLDELITRRERVIKKTRSKIGNSAYSYNPTSPIHNYTVEFRWKTVRKIIGEIYKGLENG